MRYLSAVLLSAIIMVAAVWFLGGSQSGEPKAGPKPSPSRPSAQPHVYAPPVSFPELVRDADRIFVGSVMKIEAARITNPGLDDVAVEEVSFRVHQVMKGELGKILTIRQATSLGVFREKTGQLLIYLSPNSKVGLTQPIGIYSGYFKVQPDMDHNGKLVAINLHGNEGLWGEARNLVGDGRAQLTALQVELSALNLSELELSRLTNAARARLTRRTARSAF
jgi:hypothetical protein